MRDLANNISVVQSLAPAVRTADANGTGVDLQGFEGATIVVDSGAEGDTLSSSVKIDFKLEESSDNSTFSAVTAATSVTDGTVDSSGIFLTLDDNAASCCIRLGTRVPFHVLFDLEKPFWLSSTELVQFIIRSASQPASYCG